MLTKNYYDRVEEPGFLKNILYSDSVSENMRTIVKFKNSYIEYIKFYEIWDRLAKEIPVTIKNGKEYLFIKDEIKTTSYNIKTDSWNFYRPQYLMRHKINDQIVRINFTNIASLDVTKNHSMLDYDSNNKSFVIKNPMDMEYVPVLLLSIQSGYNQNEYIDHQLFCKNPKYKLLFQLEQIKITSKELIEYNGYVYDLCIPETQNFIANKCLVHNTDSLFIVIPAKDSEKLSTQEKLKISDKVSEDINNAIIKYLNEYFLPKSNVSVDQNTTYFKSEMLIDSIMFLDVKKTYAYKLLAMKGQIFDKPSIEYTGIQVVRSNASKLTQDILREIIENVALNENVPPKEKIIKTTKIINDYHEKFMNYIENFDLVDIAIPGKWSKADMFINGMLLYNFIMKEEVFSMGSAGYFIYCVFKDPSLFQNSKLNMSKIKGIVIPRSYDKTMLKNKFEQFQILIDKQQQWDTLYSTTIDRVVNLVKSVS